MNRNGSSATIVVAPLLVLRYGACSQKWGMLTHAKPRCKTIDALDNNGVIRRVNLTTLRDMGNGLLRRAVVRRWDISITRKFDHPSCPGK
eukprot:3850361-Amphidinium_carterae.1